MPKLKMYEINMTSRILDNFKTQEMCDKEVEKDPPMFIVGSVRSF